MKEKEEKKKRKSHAWRRGERKTKKMNDTSLRNLWLTGGRNASRQETKLIHVTRAMRGF